MICRYFEGSRMAGGTLQCGPGVTEIGSWLAFGILIVSLALLTFMLVKRRNREGISVLALLAVALLLAFAAGRPVLQFQPTDAPTSGGLVVALIDTSESVWRDEAVTRAALEHLATRAAALPPEAQAAEHWRGMVLGFAENTTQLAPVGPLERLPALIRSVQKPPTGLQSRGDLGIGAALDQIRQAGGQGVILLLSDGHFDTEIPPALLERASMQGVSISFHSVGAAFAGNGLVAANLGPEQHIGSDAVLRGTVLGGGKLRASSSQDDETEVVIAPREVLQPVRLSTRFLSRGIQHLRLSFEGDRATQERVLYTLVHGPARMLVFGEAPAVDGLDPSRWTIERALPADPPQPEDFDVVLVDALSPEAFPPDYPEKLLKAARRTGVFLVNGEMRGTEEDPQVIGDWNDTVLSSILPVDSDPRLFVLEPPGRDVVILIDVSGSMGGSFNVAKATAKAILDQLRPQDTLAILPFSDSPGAAFGKRNASPQALVQARKFVERLSVGGGTAPDSTLQRAAQMRTNYCAFFFISDGGFSLPATSPQCYTTAISTEGLRFPTGVADWGQEILLRGGRGVGAIKFDYFEPEEREAFYRPEFFVPIPSQASAPLTSQGVPGVAIAYPRIDADVLSLHANPPPDPVLVMRRDTQQAGFATGVFLSALGPFTSAEELDDVFTRLLGWSRPERFDIRMHQSGDTLTVTVLTLSQAGSTDIPETLGGTLRMDGQGTQPLAFRRSGAPGRFEATLTLRLAEAPIAAELILTEAGSADQIIPVELPAKSAVRRQAAQEEAFDYGVNSSALKRVSQTTGGFDLVEAAPRLASADLPGRRYSLQSLTICLALLLMVVGLWVRGRPK